MWNTLCLSCSSSRRLKKKCLFTCDKYLIFIKYLSYGNQERYNVARVRHSSKFNYFSLGKYFWKKFHNWIRTEIVKDIWFIYNNICIYTRIDAIILEQIFCNLNKIKIIHLHAFVILYQYEQWMNECMSYLQQITDRLFIT